jgi:hypothetical protein
MPLGVLLQRWLAYFSHFPWSREAPLVVFHLRRQLRLACLHAMRPIKALAGGFKALLGC